MENAKGIRKFKNGRTPKGADKRIKESTVSFSEAEFQKANELLALTNIRSLAEYCRIRALEDFKRLYEEPKYVLEYNATIRKMGINLNQLSKNIAFKYPILNTDDIKNELKEIGDLLKNHFELAKNPKI